MLSSLISSATLSVVSKDGYASSLDIKMATAVASVLGKVVCCHIIGCSPFCMC